MAQAPLHRTAALLLRTWLAAMGPWRLLVSGLVAAAMAGFGPRLAATRHPGFDGALLGWLGQHVPPALGRGLLLVYQLSGIHFTAILVAAVLLFLALKRFWAELACLVAGASGIVLMVDRWLKPLFDRRRPPDQLLEDISGRSFPSGHAAGSVVFYFLTATLLSGHYPRLRRPLFLGSSLWVLLVWLSTLYCRAHWLTDLLAGAALGYVWLSCCLAGFTAWEQLQGRRPST